VSPETIAVIISCAGFFFTCLGNAIILGFYLGGMKSDMRIMGDRLAKIEGMFTLVPRRENKDVGEALSLGLVSVGRAIFPFRASSASDEKGSVHPK
jgi:hypothetical protein